MPICVQLVCLVLFKTIFQKIVYYFVHIFILFAGQNPEMLWIKIEDAIRSVVLLKEPKISRLVKNYASKRNFFEMVRFDFAVDDKMNVFIMEVTIHTDLLISENFH